MTIDRTYHIFAVRWLKVHGLAVPTQCSSSLSPTELDSERVFKSTHLPCHCVSSSRAAADIADPKTLISQGSPSSRSRSIAAVSPSRKPSLQQLPFLTNAEDHRFTVVDRHHCKLRSPSVRNLIS
ncbi:hypothetical protein EJB05_30800, partial [Eragrostis curvula]